MDTKKTAIYVRISTDTGNQSTDSQLHELKRYCEVQTWKSLEVYEDRMSGTKASRPRFDEMLNDMRAGKVARIICYKLDRMGRSLSHLSLVIDELSRRKIPLICVSQSIDTSDTNPCGVFQLQVLMAVAQFERSLIKERVLAGLASARSKGIRLGRRPTLIKRQEDILKLRAQGLGVRAIGRKLDMPPSSVSKVLRAAATDRA